jgi:hypothetical protein
MGKRCSRFERRPRDFYPTPEEAVAPLIRHLAAARIRTFAEPCCGDGDLVRHLERHGLRCVYAGDISTGRDALACESFSAPVITNPPWSRGVLHPMIAHFMQAAPVAWLLFDSDWSHTRQSTALIKHCSLILPIGRVKWIPGTEHAGLQCRLVPVPARAHRRAGSARIPLRERGGRPLAGAAVPNVVRPTSRGAPIPSSVLTPAANARIGNELAVTLAVTSQFRGGPPHV